VSFGLIVALLLTGLVVGALARLAVPGPDPMPVWATIALGLAGSILGGVLFQALFGGTGVPFAAAVVASTLLLIAYRRFVQKRPIWGPGAKRL
jgi:uncharacterized membrane protein YeaQ/YmgE (transglycosylase-associated protein family)